MQGAAPVMKKPRTRPDIPPRSNDNRKRKLFEIMDSDRMKALFHEFICEGSSKHKQHPHLFGLEPFRGDRGDRTLCDRHAGFNPADISRIPRLLGRAQSASLVGSFMWTVDDNGWIYELAATNSAQNQYHGYPLRPSEAIAEQMFRRFDAWARLHGSSADVAAARACTSFYGFRS
jgi:hypothetical protein